ncbi:MAG: hypothetical protein CMI54_01660 [Parcubacteria group bacterium]|nr:hypothetical protein [Parcubacteria group bacterium]|tara:strand:+ start:21724 stop:21975 length:252 start_codon:yes stop_codon:yes gene_type:complete
MKYKSNYGAVVRDAEGRNKQYFGDYEYWDGVAWVPVTISDYEFGLITGLEPVKEEKPANLGEQLEKDNILIKTNEGWKIVEKD